MSKRLSHAQHNEMVCDFLCAKRENVDWVITTAFYSALHFFEHKIFPLTLSDSSGNKYKVKNFDDYYLHTYPKREINQHSARLKLIEQYQPSMSANYKWLKDTCWTARYCNYIFKEEDKYIAETKRRLSEIKNNCSS